MCKTCYFAALNLDTNIHNLMSVRASVYFYELKNRERSNTKVGKVKDKIQNCENNGVKMKMMNSIFKQN